MLSNACNRCELCKLCYAFTIKGEEGGSFKSMRAVGQATEVKALSFEQTRLMHTCTGHDCIDMTRASTNCPA